MYILNFLLIAAWLAMTLGVMVDCVKSNNQNKAAWIVAILLLPFLGPVLYLLFAHGRFVSEL